ncbi:hypothetical protein ATCC90586_003866 [Pythium insidiosum]|nr:hypothetical protein ATCC90586_003866 [Pythium insidiosum]
MFPSEYVFGLPLTKELKDSIQERTRQQLSEMLGVEVDNVMAEYVVVMIGNNKSMAQIAHDLVDFIGEEHAQQFVAWLSVVLKTLEAPNESSTTTEDDDLEALAPPSAESDEKPNGDDDSTASSKRVVSLKGISGGSSATSSSSEKKTVVLAGSSSASGTVRSLNRGSSDMQDVLARRSQRFGLPTPTEAPKTKQDGQGKRGTGRDAGDKPKAGGVKRKNESEGGEDSHSSKRPGSASRPYGMYYPPPYGMPPYGMGFPPHQGMPRGPYAPPPMPPGGQKPHYQPRGPRPSFQNRKWVNPNVAKAEGEASTGDNEATQESGNESAPQEAGANTPQLNVKAAPFMPRNPYYSSQMRPRFQNKTWVRPDAAPEPTAKDDEDLSASLPTTPPPENVNAA